MQGIAGHEHNLTPKQHKAVACLLSEATISAAAAKAGIAERTLHGWLQDPLFEAAYRAVRREAVGQAVARLQQMSTHAVTVLATVMADKTTPPSTRVMAAKSILEFAIRAVELEDLEARLAVLEQAMKEHHA